MDADKGGTAAEGAYDAIHKESVSDEELSAAVGAVLTQGNLIVDLARKEAERWAE